MGGHLRLCEQAMKTIKWDENGLIAAIIQDHKSKDVLMMAYMDAEALRRTLDYGETVFWSRSRQQYWRKGATSGNIQKVIEIRIDCDADALLILVDAAGPACHTGERCCFYRQLSDFNDHPERV